MDARISDENREQVARAVAARRGWKWEMPHNIEQQARQRLICYDMFDEVLAAAAQTAQPNDDGCPFGVLRMMIDQARPLHNNEHPERSATNCWYTDGFAIPRHVIDSARDTLAPKRT